MKGKSTLICRISSLSLLQVLELLQENGEEGFDTMCLLRTRGQVKTDAVDGKKTCQETKKSEGSSN